MDKKFQVVVFGKKGCEKCASLNKRLDTILKKKEWQDFEKVYMDVHTEDGLIAFSKAECLNPQRIPAFVVVWKNSQNNALEPVPNPKMGQKDEVCGDARLHTHLGLQTDYSGEGKGVISPKMIKQILQEAVAYGESLNRAA